MIRLLAVAGASLLSLLAAGCHSCGKAPRDAVAAIAAANPDCVRLTLHCRGADGNATVCASTDAARVGTASDPEDLRAMTTNETVVLEEGDNLDVTVPLLHTDGACTTVCGVTLRPGGKSRAECIAKAEAIAADVAAQLGGCCPN